MAKELCEDCGKVFDGGPTAFFCPECKKKRLSRAAKERNLNKLGNAAYSNRQKRKIDGCKFEDLDKPFVFCDNDSVFNILDG